MASERVSINGGESNSVGPVVAVGDRVIWRGAWGTELPAEAVVSAILVCSAPGVKYGDLVESIPWELVRSHSRAVIFDLVGDSWAWGFQVEPWDRPAGRPVTVISADGVEDGELMPDDSIRVR